MKFKVKKSINSPQTIKKAHKLSIQPSRQSIMDNQLINYGNQTIKKLFKRNKKVSQRDIKSNGKAIYGNETAIMADRKMN